MKSTIAGILVLVLLVYYTAPVDAAIGQSAVITLVMPYGARSEAMGEVGTALGDDESVLYFNPAGLDVPNDRWQGGAGTYFNQPLLPAFQLPSLYQRGVAANVQDSSWDLGAFGLFYNYVNMGTSDITDQLGNYIAQVESFEQVFALGWGFDFEDIGLKDQYFGITLKGFESDLDGSIARSLAIDLGYLWVTNLNVRFDGGNIDQNFRFGATLMNMGPSVWYANPDLRDPIPFTINFALAYKNAFDVDNFSFFKLAGELRMEREVVTNNGDGNPPPFYDAIWSDLFHDRKSGESTFSEQMQQWVEHLGGELTFLNTLNLRGGYLIGIAGEQYEKHSGYGITLLNHLCFDYSYISSPEGYLPGIVRKFDPSAQGSSGAREGQKEISLTLTRILNWRQSDLQWWRER
jgi:hypothetical protein